MDVARFETERGRMLFGLGDSFFVLYHPERSIRSGDAAADAWFNMDLFHEYPWRIYEINNADWARIKQLASEKDYSGLSRFEGSVLVDASLTLAPY